MRFLRYWLKWLRPGLYLKRWVLLISVGVVLISFGLTRLLGILFTRFHQLDWLQTFIAKTDPTLFALGLFALGIVLTFLGWWQLNLSLAEPFGATRSFRELLRIVRTHQQLRQGMRVVAIGGGTGLPSTLRAMKTETSNITAIVTMADDGGSSGRLRRDYGMQPPGDLRSNITALAQDEALMTRLFDYRFPSGELGGHSFGNLLLAALFNLEGRMDKAADAAGRILAIQGRVLPCTLDDVHLVAEVEHHGTKAVAQVEGESNIPSTAWQIRQVALKPSTAALYSEVLQSITDAQLIIVGPGSLYTSIVPNLIVLGMQEAIRASKALKIYVCNIATQPGETDNYTVADHLLGIERHVGANLFDVVLANDHYPTANAGPNTIYVKPAPITHPVNQRYRIIYSDLTDNERPWRHSPQKLRGMIVRLYGEQFQPKAQRISSGKFDVLR